jgi:hypothetical protein
MAEHAAAARLCSFSAAIMLKHLLADVHFFLMVGWGLGEFSINLRSALLRSIALYAQSYQFVKKFDRKR